MREESLVHTANKLAHCHHNYPRFIKYLWVVFFVKQVNSMRDKREDEGDFANLANMRKVLVLLFSTMAFILFYSVRILHFPTPRIRVSIAIFCYP